MAGRPIVRARIAVCEFAEPLAVTRPKTLARSSCAVSLGARSSAKMMWLSPFCAIPFCTIPFCTASPCTLPSCAVLSRLCKVAQEEFEYPYFFQTEYTDVGSLRGHAQLRNSATTGILAGERNQKYSFNQGIFLDIFPLDNIPDDKRQRENQAKKIRHYKNRACFWAKFTTRYSGTSKSVLKQNVKKMISGLFGNFMEKYQLEKRDYCRFEKACEEFDFDKTLLVSTLSLAGPMPFSYFYKFLTYLPSFFQRNQVRCYVDFADLS